IIILYYLTIPFGIGSKYNVGFEEWHELLMDYAELRGGSAADAEAWRDDYEAGKTPVEAYCDEWGGNDSNLLIVFYVQIMPD
ncbi:hypothetical protein HEO20_024640, partial [Escherichia coli]|nr:hypothetical protein [Escherichia coli]